MKPCIALLTNNDDDVYCFRLELIRSIINSGYALLVSCPDGPKFSQLALEGLQKGVDYIYDDPPIDRRGTNILQDAKLLLHYCSLLRKYHPDVILTYTAKPNVYANFAAWTMGIPVISNVTGLGSVIHETGMKQKLILWLYKTALRRAACIMFQNSTNLDLALKSGWVKGEYHLIPGSGVALDRFPVQLYPNGGNGIQGEPIIFNYIGRILHDKGVDDFIEAAKQVKSSYPNVEFNMVGFVEPSESHYLADLQELEREGLVFYRGSQVDVRPWIARSHCVIQPSTYGEGMSNVLLENAASARPIITTDNPGCRETVEDGATGYIYPGGDVEALISCVVRFIADLTNDRRVEMGLLGRKKVEKEFDREIVVAAYMKEIERIVGSREHSIRRKL